MLVVIGRWCSKRSCDTCSADNRREGLAVPQERSSFDFPKILERRLGQKRGREPYVDSGKEEICRASAIVIIYRSLTVIAPVDVSRAQIGKWTARMAMELTMDDGFPICSSRRILNRCGDANNSL